jgi:regulation of enolase protein 1 (concanavalin A-like superfamily)
LLPAIVNIPGLPLSLHWLLEPRGWSAEDGRLTIEAPEGSDWFVDPSGVSPPAVNAPALVGEATGDFILSARATVEFAADFDAGVLMVYADERRWAKLCFEYSPQRQPMIVSVVTNGRSDDANSFDVDGNQAWLRIARLGAVFALHASVDGEAWQLVRWFTLGEDVEPAVGFEAQSPTGAGCVVAFDEIRWQTERLANLRDGS